MSPTETSSSTILLLEGIHAAADEALENGGITITRRAAALGGEKGADGLADHLDGRLDGGLDGMAMLGIRSKSRVTAAVLDAAPDLLAIGCFCIGTNQVDLAEAGRRGVAVFNAPFANTRSVAEMTIAEIVALHRRLVEKSTELHGGRWDKSAAHAHEVRGRTLGIVGYGHIGSQVSVLAEALGMRVVYHDIVAKLPHGNARALPDLDAVLAASDVVSLHVPATSATAGMISEAQLERMRDGAYLINNSRGSVVDMDALAGALRSGRLGGAAVDVFPEEPDESQAPFSCPLAGLPNVILTPHVGGSTTEAQESIARDVSAKLARYLRNGTTTSAVNVPEVELPHPGPGQHRILHIHHNVPGVLSKINGILAELGVNINAEHLQSNREVSYVILDIDPHHGDRVRERIAEIPETIRVRALW